MNFVFATHNDNKVREIKSMISAIGVSIMSLSDLNIHEEIIENGKNIAENARIKSDFIFDKVGGNVIADDTGLEVDVLSGAPGVYSARYAGDQKNSEENMDLLLTNLRDHTDRSAQFRTVLATWMNGQQFTFEGIVRGKIAFERKGCHGFGYDPIFIPENHQKTFGELPLEIKNNISHRGRAFQAFKDHLLKLT